MIEDAIQPDNIMWENLSVGKKERAIRVGIANFIGLLALLFSFIGLTILNNVSIDIKNDFKVPIVCPTTEISKQQALTDHLNIGKT